MTKEIVLRPYQLEAIEAVHNYICNKEGNPCVVLPTGSGKSVVMAALINKWKKITPNVRGCILAHRKELITQNASKFIEAYGSNGVGIFSAGLGQRDYKSPILFSSIDSIYNKSGEFKPFDFIFVDESHRIPPSGEGKYRTFILGCKKFNPRIPTIGWTATEFRLGCGAICHKDHILNEVCYKADINDLINQGYLCNLRSKVGENQPDLSEVRSNGKGDYVINSLANATNKGSVVQSAIAESVRIMESEQRKSAIFFCVDVEHSQRVSEELRKFGIYCPSITGMTKTKERDRIIEDFKNGYIKAICNVNVLTEGFDAPHIDTIVLLRPTLSAGLFSQMVGRGLRPYKTKSYCLVLDFAGCIDEHGPIDLLGGDIVVMAICQECRESFSRAIKKCPICGWEIPKREVDRLEQVETERRMHGAKVSNRSILSGEPETLVVDSVYVSRHTKPESPDSLRVQYRCGMRMFRECVCLEHPGFAGQNARKWWKKRFGGDGKISINEVLENLLISQELLDWTKTITVKRNKKYYEVIGYNDNAS